MSFTALDTTDFVVSTDAITAPAWSSNQPTLTQFFTAPVSQSTTITQDAFYLNVYQTASSAVGAAVQFSIAYGNQLGSGSQYFNQLVPGVSPSAVTYGQYKTLVYGTGLTAQSSSFNFGGLNTGSRDIWVINVDRNRYKESLFTTTFNLSLSGSGGTVKLTNDSLATNVVTFLDCGRVFNIVSGSNGNPVTFTIPGAPTNGHTVSGSYGLFLPDIGTLILNPRALALPAASGGISLAPDETNNPSYLTSSLSNTILYQAISRSANFQLNSQETVSSNYVFVRVRNTDYNYSANPTYLSGSSGELVYSTLINNPQTYVTTVGLYNQANELLAVGKMSRPLVKDFTKEALVRVKLDW